MKKLLTGIFTAAMVLSIGATGAFAACMGQGRRYTDANGDGVCDNLTYRTQSTACARFVDSNGDGICDSCGTGYGFVDANGDGICDNQGAHCQNGTCGNGYVDANGDGVCDNQGSRPRNGSGLQRGFCGGRNK